MAKLAQGLMDRESKKKFIFLSKSWILVFSILFNFFYIVVYDVIFNMND